MPTPEASPETPFRLGPGYADHYSGDRFRSGHGPRTNARETAVIATLLGTAHADPGGWLDVPCGAGRLTGLLSGSTIAADRSLPMLGAHPGPQPRIQASAKQLPFASGAFAGVLCIRLLHHMNRPGERLQILRELARVSRGPVLLSFYHARSLQHLRRVLNRRIKRKPASSRGAVSWRVFHSELLEAGLEVERVQPLRRHISEQWLVLCRVKRDG